MKVSQSFFEEHFAPVHLSGAFSWKWFVHSSVQRITYLIRKIFSFKHTVLIVSTVRSSIREQFGHCELLVLNRIHKHWRPFDSLPYGVSFIEPWSLASNFFILFDLYSDLFYVITTFLVFLVFRKWFKALDFLFTKPLLYRFSLIPRILKFSFFQFVNRFNDHLQVFKISHSLAFSLSEITGDLLLTDTCGVSAIGDVGYCSKTAEEVWDSHYVFL